MSPQVGGPGKVYQVPLGLTANALRHLCDRPSQGPSDADIILTLQMKKEDIKKLSDFPIVT